jgi:hypothetical protein
MSLTNEDGVDSTSTCTSTVHQLSISLAMVGGSLAGWADVTERGEGGEVGLIRLVVGLLSLYCSRYRLGGWWIFSFLVFCFLSAVG